jgi:hypothetical protein
VARRYMKGSVAISAPLSVALLLSLLVAASCGNAAQRNPAPQDQGLLRIAAAPAAVRDTALVAIVRPSASAAQIAALQNELSLRAEVRSWAVASSPQTTAICRAIWSAQFGAVQARLELLHLRAQHGGRLPAAAFVVILRGDPDTDPTDVLSNWFLRSGQVLFTWSLTDGELSGASAPVPL